MLKTKLSKRKSKPFDINGDGVVDYKDFLAIFSGERHYQPTSAEYVADKVKSIWVNHQHHFDSIAIKIQKRIRENKTFFYKFLSKNDKHIEKIVLGLFDSFNDRELEFFRNDFFEISSKITSISRELAELKAASIMETSDKYAKSIAKLEGEITHLKELRERSLTFFVNRFSVYGIKLDMKQGEALIARVDAGNIAQMISVFYLISEVVQQLSLAKKETGEDLAISKKYYAIFVGLLELQIHVQNQYIAKVDNVFLPKLNAISSQSEQLHKQTKGLKKNADPEYKEAYEKNIQSQVLNIRVTKLYSELLVAERTRVIKARKLVCQRYELAENTLRTVTISSELTHLIKKNEELYLDVMNLQTPELQEFENLAMKEEFIKITEKIGL